MNKRRSRRAVLLTGVTGLALAGACGMWLRSYRHHEDLNRHLIAALEKQNPSQALALINAGADPNTPWIPSPPPSLTDLWNHLVHRTEMPYNDSPSAFHVACGARTHLVMHYSEGLNTDEPYLVKMMLQHGAQKNAKDYKGETPLMWSAATQHSKTVDVLLKHGVDVNARDDDGETALWKAISCFSLVDPSERISCTNVVRELLAHGADPNLPNAESSTFLQLAHEVHSPELVAILKQAGAKW